jgi:hypothetical protein
MNELIDAAKAVCDQYDYTGTVEECEAVNRLYAAVERAEKQDANFEEWFVKNYKGVFDLAIYESIKAAWITAKQGERGRIKQIIHYQFSELVSDLSEVMEMIDDVH